MAILKRDFLNNDIFKELAEKYPPLDAENGVAYKQKLEYLTFETDFLTDAKLRMLRQKYGNDIVAIIFFMRTEMCGYGWKIRIDGEYYYSLIDDCSHICKIGEEIVKNALGDLISEKIFFVVQDERFEQGKWLTCTQQVYNYEMACNNRKSNRARKAKSRAKSKNANIDAPQELDVPCEQKDFVQDIHNQNMALNQNTAYQQNGNNSCPYNPNINSGCDYNCIQNGGYNSNMPCYPNNYNDNDDYNHEIYDESVPFD